MHSSERLLSVDPETLSRLLPSHFVLLGASWFVFMNLAIIAANFRHLPACKIIHILLSIVSVALTYGLAIPLITPDLVDDDIHVVIHQKMGVAALVVSGLQVLLGFTMGIIQWTVKNNSFWIYWTRKAHLVLGYLTSGMAKATGLYMFHFAFFPVFAALLAVEFLFLMFLIYLKFFRPSLQEVIDPKIDNAKLDLIRPITGLLEISYHISNFATFGNLVYDLTPLKANHPCGYQIVDSVKGKDIDRYLYGMYRSEALPSVPANSHSAASMSLLGSPFAKICIQSPYNDYSEDNTEFCLKSIENLDRSEIYQLNFAPKHFHSFSYAGYTNITQLGRFRSLTYEGITRLYTAANFLVDENKKIMRSLMPQYKERSKNQITYDNLESQNELESKRQFLPNEQKDSLPLLIKRYPNGLLTPNLMKLKKNCSVTISAYKGAGLRLNQTPSGRIILVAGGTGMLPFCDLIDLLYKRLLIGEGSPVAQLLIQKNPILKSSPFDRFTFLVMGAFQSLEQLHPITFNQMHKLATKMSWFRCILKIKSTVPSAQQTLIKFTNKGFQSILEEEMKTSFSKIIICGPPAMNENLTAMMNSYGISDTKWMIL